MKSLKNLKDSIQEAFDKILRPGKDLGSYSPPPPDQINWAPIEQAVGINQPTPSPNSTYNSAPTNTPTSSPVQTPMPTPMPINDISEKIRKGLVDYGGENLPALDYIPLFEQAAQQYPVFAHNPYLLPQISILESSGGRNITRPNNPLNWGARMQAQGLFNPISYEESINKAVSGIGERMGAYEPFRVDRPLTEEEIYQFANIYEPANQSYGPNLFAGIQRFQELGGQ